MRKRGFPQAERYAKRNQRRRTWRKFVRIMACVVVFCTTYALILPAITMERATCEIEEHVHSQSCYTEQPVFVLQCVPDSGDLTVHSHDALCFDAQGALRCTLPEVLEHTHDAACYGKTLACTAEHVCDESCVTTEKVLVCTEAVREAHTHSEACVSVQQVLNCDAADPDHVHGETCYETREVPCTLTEGEGHAHDDGCYELREIPCALVHTHGESCYVQSDLPTCGKEEVATHIHEENCYASDGVLVCTKPVVYRHIHTESCLVETGETRQVLTCGMEEVTSTTS